MILWITQNPAAAVALAVLAGLVPGLALALWGRARARARADEWQRQLDGERHAWELEGAEWRHRVDTLTEQAQALTRECADWRADCHSTREKLEQQSQRRAALEERIERFQSQQSELEQQRERVIQLSQQRTELQTQLEEERKQLAQQSEFLEKTKADLKREFELTANKLFERKTEQFNTSSQSLLEGTLSPFKNQLQEFRKKVEDVYEKENAERNRLGGQIQELQRQTHKISEDAVNLAQALKGNNKAQGGWGEVVLERLLEQSGLQKGREYETQFSATSEQGQRRMPDVVVHLPDNKDIIIDAKVSLTDYERYCNSEDEDERQAALAQHIQSLRQHIKGLSAKEYESLPGIRALDFVFIFIPIEAAFMLALQYEPNLYKEAYDKQVILASPTTLLAILRTVDNVWRYEKQNKNAERIAKEAGGLHDQFVLMVEALDAVGTQLDKTRAAYDTAHKRLTTGRGNLVRRVANIRKLGAKTKKHMETQLLEKAEDADALAPDNDED